MKIEEILNATKGKLICGDINEKCKNFKRDTREIENGDVYIALKGERFD